MKDKLEVGMYVRTEHKGICKIKGFASSLTDDYIENEKGSMIPKDEIIKSSSNIIDLIEVGDYVNGCYVDEIISDNDSWDDRKHFHLLKFISYFSEEDIKSIVTKEQFESMAYKVGE